MGAVVAIHRAPALMGELARAIEAMLVIQMEAYPSHLTDEEKRELAERHLFGSRS